MSIAQTAFYELLSRRFDRVLIDRVLETQPDFVVGVKNVGIDDCQSHINLSGEPYYPEQSILACLTQASFLLFSQQPDRLSQDCRLVEVVNTKYLGVVTSGDQLRLEVSLEESRSDQQCRVGALGLVDGHVVCEATLEFAFTQAPSKPQIHPTAWVHPTAVLGQDVVIGAYSIVKEHVVIGDRTILEAHVMVEKWSQIGEDCHIYFGTVVGSSAQDVKYKGEKSLVKIGDRCVIREYVTINRATGPEAVTEIGCDNLIFTGAHIGHNCRIGNHVILTNLVQLGGHCDVEDHAILGGNVGVHQFVRIGTGSMVGGYSRLASDVAPYTLCEGNPAEVRSLNVVGIKRRGAGMTDLKELKHVFKTLFRNKLNTQQALDALAQMDIQSEYAKRLIAFFNEDSKRGVLKRRQS